MKAEIRSKLKKFITLFGVDIRLISRLPVAGSGARPIGDIRLFLEDLRARSFVPRGIMDIGAHRGDWGRMALSIFPSVHLLMIEPQPEMASSLNRIVREFPGALYIPSGVGRVTGTLNMNIADGDKSGASFLPQSEGQSSQAPLVRELPITTIDTILREKGAGFYPDLVKLDIQGFELEALSGGESLFGKTEVFILETSLFRFLSEQPILSEVIIFMAERGYKLYDIPGYARRPHDGALGQLDLAFVKQSGILRNSTLWQ